VITAIIIYLSQEGYAFVGYHKYYDAHEGMWDRLAGGFSPYLSLILFAGLAALLAHLAYRGWSSKSSK